MEKHIKKVAQSAHFAIRNIGRIRQYLDKSSAEKLIHAFVTSRLDNCNILLYGMPKTQLNHLQRVQNIAARLVARNKKSPDLASLHWLPVAQRTVFKVLLMTYKALNGFAPTYVREMITPYEPVRPLRTLSTRALVPAQGKTKTYGE